jgi:signal peptidase I
VTDDGRSRKRRARVVVGLVLAATFGALALVGLRGHAVYAVSTGSMAPTIPPRSAVVVTKDVAPQIGDVITYEHHGALVTHRLVAINADGTLRTKGDANDTPDAWGTPRSDVVGVVTSHVPQVGYWLVYLRTPQGFASFVLMLLLLGQVWSWVLREDGPRRAPRHALGIVAADRPVLDLGTPGFGRSSQLRPCLVTDAAEPVPGTVLAWRHEGSGWEALVRHRTTDGTGRARSVERWLPRTAVEPL